MSNPKNRSDAHKKNGASSSGHTNAPSQTSNDQRSRSANPEPPRRVIKDSPVKGSISLAEAREAARFAKLQRSAPAT
jgi:hypothetical protein